jgi:hypothetical protein
VQGRAGATRRAGWSPCLTPRSAEQDRDSGTSRERTSHWWRSIQSSVKDSVGRARCGVLSTVSARRVLFVERLSFRIVSARSTVRAGRDMMATRWFARSLATRAVLNPEAVCDPAGVEDGWLGTMPITLAYQSTVASPFAIANPKRCSVGRILSRLTEASDMRFSFCAVRRMTAQRGGGRMSQAITEGIGET